MALCFPGDETLYFGVAWRRLAIEAAAAKKDTGGVVRTKGGHEGGLGMKGLEKVSAKAPFRSSIVMGLSVFLSPPGAPAKTFVVRPPDAHFL